jgi:hypothetical protein
MKHLALSDEEAGALIKELRDPVDRDLYLLSPRIRTQEAFWLISDPSQPASLCRQRRSSGRRKLPWLKGDGGVGSG